MYKYVLVCLLLLTALTGYLLLISALPRKCVESSNSNLSIALPEYVPTYHSDITYNDNACLYLIYARNLHRFATSSRYAMPILYIMLSVYVTIHHSDIIFNYIFCLYLIFTSNLYSFANSSRYAIAIITKNALIDKTLNKF